MGKKEYDPAAALQVNYYVVKSLCFMLSKALHPVTPPHALFTYSTISHITKPVLSPLILCGY